MIFFIFDNDIAGLLVLIFSGNRWFALHCSFYFNVRAQKDRYNQGANQQFLGQISLPQSLRQETSWVSAG